MIGTQLQVSVCFHDVQTSRYKNSLLPFSSLELGINVNSLQQQLVQQKIQAFCSKAVKKISARASSCEGRLIRKLLPSCKFETASVRRGNLFRSLRAT
ncbi:Uncharacterized protein TCM_010482 [Theobroma cacao]|uniref:Uncharacterized protein n=1 Tax=Theobroma cacao TaxID=3641 RepID=A0A061E7I9_THECC|nr:Uncharacterized protein TCM_010482 [Theobroma cacao]